MELKARIKPLQVNTYSFKNEQGQEYTGYTVRLLIDDQYHPVMVISFTKECEEDLNLQSEAVRKDIENSEWIATLKLSYSRDQKSGLQLIKLKISKLEKAK